MSQDDMGPPRENAGGGAEGRAHMHMHILKSTRKFRGARAKGMRTDLHDFCIAP